jgi:hypothetical protein
MEIIFHENIFSWKLLLLLRTKLLLLLQDETFKMDGWTAVQPIFTTLEKTE